MIILGVILGIAALASLAGYWDATNIKKRNENI